jgi:hypothetical protein
LSIGPYIYRLHTLVHYEILTIIVDNDDFDLLARFTIACLLKRGIFYTAVKHSGHNNFKISIFIYKSTLKVVGIKINKTASFRGVFYGCIAAL